MIGNDSSKKRRGIKEYPNCTVLSSKKMDNIIKWSPLWIVFNEKK